MARVRAPELSGRGGWLGVDRPLSLSELRGRIVLLHFWTFSCVNCIRVLDEIRRLEQRFSDQLVVLGVHSPKFPREADHAAVAHAVARHRLAHPVLDDPDMETWSRYGVRAWPGLVLVDGRGYVVTAVSGEGHGRELEKLIAGLMGEPDDAGAVGPVTVDDDRALPLRPLLPPGGPLAYPAKVAVSPDGQRLAVADTAHDQVLVCTTDGLVLDVHTGFSAPQGVRFDGEVVVVCDTGANRVVRSDGVVVADGIAAPSDLVVHEDGSLMVAEAGRHRLRRVRPGEQRVLVAAGTGGEGLQDGPAPQALLAQPSGLARVAGGIAFADAEASALRVLTTKDEVTTLVGEGLFEWGAEDGPPGHARLQHPLGVAGAGDGRHIFVADTYNCLLRVWDGQSLQTLPVTGLEEPGGLDVLPDGRLVVADTNHHRVVIVDPASGAVEPVVLDDSWVMSTEGPPLSAAAGQPFPAPVGIHLADEELDEAAGPVVRVAVEARPPSLLAAGTLRWSLPTADGEVQPRAGRPGAGLLLVEVRANTCRDGRSAVRVSRRRHRLDVAGTDA